MNRRDFFSTVVAAVLAPKVTAVPLTWRNVHAIGFNGKGIVSLVPPVGSVLWVWDDKTRDWRIAD